MKQNCINMIQMYKDKLIGLLHFRYECITASNHLILSLVYLPQDVFGHHWNHYCCYATETITVAMTLNHMLYKMILWYEGLPYDPLVHTVSRFISTNIVQVDLHTTIIYHNNTWTLTSTDKSKVYLHMSVSFI